MDPYRAEMRGARQCVATGAGKSVFSADGHKDGEKVGRLQVASDDSVRRTDAGGRNASSKDSEKRRRDALAGDPPVQSLMNKS